jgi:hypothetical protein
MYEFIHLRKDTFVMCPGIFPYVNANFSEVKHNAILLAVMTEGRDQISFKNTDLYYTAVDTSAATSRPSVNDN